MTVKIDPRSYKHDKPDNSIVSKIGDTIFLKFESDITFHFKAMNKHFFYTYRLSNWIITGMYIS